MRYRRQLSRLTEIAGGHEPVRQSQSQRGKLAEVLILRIRSQLPRGHGPPAFTLVELLVSMAVLVLLTLALVGMVNSISQTTTLDRRHMEADEEARRVFDRMTFDFAKMFKRADADSIFASIIDTPATQGPNDKMFFYSESPSYFDNAPPSSSQGTAALIGYRIPNGNTTADPTHRWQLERLGKGLTWDRPSPASTPGAVVFLTYPAASPPPAASPTPFPASMLADPANWGSTIGTAPNYEGDGSTVDPDFHVLSNYVFRMEYCFVMKTASASGSLFAVAHAQSKGFSDVAAIVVAIAMLDPQGQSLIPGATPGGTADLSALATALPGPNFSSAPNKLMAEIWNGKVNDGSLATAASIPRSVAAQVRVYQHFFYLNTPP